MTKRENDSFSVKDLMESFIKENNLSKGMLQLNVAASWNKIMGNGVASYTSEVKLQNKTLIVRLTSSALREELSYGKEKIITIMNESLGEDAIDKLMLV